MRGLIFILLVALLCNDSNALDYDYRLQIWKWQADVTQEYVDSYEDLVMIYPVSFTAKLIFFSSNYSDLSSWHLCRIKINSFS